MDSNKTDLLKFLSNALLDSFSVKEKQLVVTDGQLDLSKPPLQDLDSLSPCSHEEADTRMLLHANHAAHHGHHKIPIWTVDTDVVILAVYVAQVVGSQCELWLAFGTGKQFRYLSAHGIANAFGPEKAQALPMFHALTGCDTVSSFVGHGKEKAWSIWNALPELTHALLTLSHTLTEDVLHIIQRFVILLYERTSKCVDVDKAKRELFAKRTQCSRPHQPKLL